MSKALPQSLLVDRYGKSLAMSTYSSQTRKLNNTSYTNYRNFGNSTQAESPYRFLNPSERRLVNQFSLDLYRSSAVIHSSISRKNEWVCATGWKPIFKGSNVKWGQAATNYLNQVVYPNCSISGPNMSWNRLLLTLSNQLDVAGDVLYILTQTRDGIPRLALYPSNLIGSRVLGKNIVESGRYKGAQIDDGVIMNSSDTPIGYRVLQSEKENDFDLSTRDGRLVYEPTDLSYRGISIIAPSLLTFLSVEDISQALNQTVHNQAKQQFVVSTDNGSGEEYSDSNLDGDLTQVTADTSVFTPSVVNLGPVAFVNAKNGEKIEAFKGETPHTNAQDWIRYLTESVVYDLGWALPLINPEKLTGANAKMIESQVQATISVRQATLKQIAIHYTSWALSVGMENGDIPKIATADWRMWDWSMPGLFVINSTDSDDISGWMAGTKTLQGIAASNEADWIDIRNQRQVELEDAITRADALVAKSGGKLSFERALTLVGTGAGPQVTPLAEQSISSESK